MNILYISNTLNKGGSEVHLLLLAKGLQALGVTCEVAFLREGVTGGSGDLRGDFNKAGIRTHYLKCENSWDPRIGIRLNRLLKQAKWDILHSHLPRADAAAAFCKLLNPGQAWISTLHHPYDDNAYSAAYMISAMAPMWRMADGIIAVSEPVMQWSIQRLGVLPDSVQTIVHGVDVELHKVKNEQSINDAQPVRKRFCIGTIGRYEVRKGHETLIRAMPCILREFPGAELKIAGHDPWGHGEVLKKLIAELKLEKHVQLVGFISDSEAFFSGIDVFALASLCEGFGIVVLEAMAAAKPAVVSNIAPLNNIITPGISGLVSESKDPKGFADAIISLFRDEDYLRRMGSEGFKRVASEFSTAKMVQETLHYYENVLLKTGSKKREALQMDNRAGNGMDIVRPKRGPEQENYDLKVVEGFGKEWCRFDQSALKLSEAQTLFNQYFAVFPWARLPENPEGFDLGCGSGRWDRFVAPRVSRLHCIDASEAALNVAKLNLAEFSNCTFHCATVEQIPLPDNSMDFGYSMGVLHHIPDTLSGLRSCVRKLKQGAPFLLYLYYALENRPYWYRLLWKLSETGRFIISQSPFRLKSVMCDLVAVMGYWPLARMAKLAGRLGAQVDNMPLSAYRQQSLYVMRTDALDRFGTRLEKRFTRQQIKDMMEEAGLQDIRFNEGYPYWVAVGIKN